MKQILSAISVLVLLAACDDGQPFPVDSDQTATPDPGTDPGTDPDANPDPAPGATDPLITGTVRPPQTEGAINRGDITRLEARNGGGGGLVSSVAYNPGSDTFFVDGLAFDGENVYFRGNAVSQLGPFAVFEADEIVPDFLTGDDIGQSVPYRAIYGVSTNSLPSGEPVTSFAIVRTGAYEDYGFGGFLYERNGDVVLPTTGQAIYTGDYAGMRVFDNRGGLEYTTGDMFIQFDFDDFNQNDGIYGEIFNRQAFDVNGNPISLDGPGQLNLPVVQLRVEEGDNDVLANGEFSGSGESFGVVDGVVEEYETGSYYAVIAGDMTSGNGGEIVGIVVIESTDPRFENVTVQETGGFILYRGDDN